ncbi:MAG: hypothetical protein QG622_178 [Actinomycetota bacterium]|nr:hypothetical protein [Actinomycetota bacterium]
MAKWTSARARRTVPETTAEPEPDFDWSWAEEGPAWIAPTVNTSVPSIARIYDHLLGGKDNYAIDRETTSLIRQIVPDLEALARANRDFVIRAVTVMAEAGVRQFMDLGCGIPSSPAVHEIARSIVPDAAVAYVDNDPIVVAQARAVLDGQPGLGAFLHDIREPSRVFRDTRMLELIDLGRPIGLVMTGVLNFVDLSIGPQVVGRYVDRMASGSHIAFTTTAIEHLPTGTVRQFDQLMRTAGNPIAFRTRAQVEELIDGLRLLPPGITDVSCWRTDGRPGTLRIHAGMAKR